jgi:hypothetical protein
MNNFFYYIEKMESGDTVTHRIAEKDVDAFLTSHQDARPISENEYVDLQKNKNNKAEN